MFGFGALGSYPLGATGGDPVILADLAESLIAFSGFEGDRFLRLASSAGAVDTMTAEALANLIERIVATDGFSVRATFKPSVADSAAFTDTIRAAWSMLLADTVDGTDAAVGTVYKQVAIAEAIAATDAATPRLTAYVAVAIAAALEDLASNGWNASAVDQAALTDAAGATLSAMLALADSLAASDAVSGTLFLSAVLADVATVVDSPAAALRALADLESSAMLYVSLRLGTTDYHGWALNTDAKAFSEHRGLQFDSIATVKGRHFAAGPMGIVEITGKTDDGAAIDALVTPFLTDFGTGKFKRLPDIWIGASTDGELFVKVLTRDPATGAKLEDWYLCTGKQGDNSQPHRAEIGRGLKSTFWGLTLANVDGADFRLREIAMRPLVLDRRQ